MQKLLILLTIAFSSCSSGGQSFILGEWKLIKVTVYNVFSKTTTVWYDKNNIESVKENRLKQYISEWQVNLKSLEEDSTASNSKLDRELSKLDTVDFKNKLETSLMKFDSARLVFKNDSTIYINSYGVIISTAVPGWHFGDKVGGKWTQHLKRLKLIIGDNKVNYPFFYNIIRHTNDSLILGMTNESYDEAYMTLEFTR